MRGVSKAAIMIFCPTRPPQREFSMSTKCFMYLSRHRLCTKTEGKKITAKSWICLTHTCTHTQDTLNCIMTARSDQSACHTHNLQKKKKQKKQVGFFARQRHKPTHTHSLECIADTLASRAPHDMKRKRWLEIADAVIRWKSRWLKVMLLSLEIMLCH